LLPKGNRAAFEFRHETWFDDEIFELLGKQKVALCIAEADNDLKVPFVATADWGYLRLRREDYSDAELKASVKKVQKQDWSDAFVYFRHEDTAKGRSSRRGLWSWLHSAQPIVGVPANFRRLGPILTRPGQKSLIECIRAQEIGNFTIRRWKKKKDAI